MNRLHIGRQKLARFLFRGGRARRAPGSPARRLLDITALVVTIPTYDTLAVALMP